MRQSGSAERGLSILGFAFVYLECSCKTIDDGIKALGWCPIGAGFDFACILQRALHILKTGTACDQYAYGKT
jgi:hypothetical protein